MGEHLGRAGRRPGLLFLSGLHLILLLLKRILSGSWRALGLAGLWLRRRLVGATAASWAFLGRCGLALRKLLATLIWAPFLKLIGWLKRAIGRAGRASWAFLGRCGLALRKLLTVLIWAPLLKLFESLKRAIRRVGLFTWAFLGRCGLALRNLLSYLLWQPFVWLVGPYAVSFLAFCALVGRLGLALHDLLARFVWRPLLFVSAPLRWFYRKVLRRPLRFAWLSLRTFLEWLGGDLALPAARAVPRAASAGWRKANQLQDSLGTRGPWHRAALPGNGELANMPLPLEPVSSRPRFNRLTTAVVSTSIVLLLGVLTTQGRRVDEAAALNQVRLLTRPAVAPLVPKMTLTPTATPSPTPTATPLAPALADVQPEPWPTPDPLGAGGSVAFTLRQDGNADIYALAIGRTEPVRLTGHPAEDRDPAWSPDGRRLAFSSHRDGNWEIYTLDLDTSALQRLTADPTFDGGPAWSPDGQWLVYESYRENNLDLFIIAADGSKPPIRLTEHPAQDFSPAWSPDGRHIAFTSWRSGNKDIFIMALDTASDEFALNVTSSPGLYEDHPAWEPGGRFLAYFEDSGDLELIYALPLEAYVPAGPPITVGQGRHPSWSADGSSLVYVHQNGEKSYVIGSTVEAWNVAPQAYTSDHIMDDLAWSAVNLPPGLEDRLPVDAMASRPLYVEQVEPPQRTGPAFLLQQVSVDAPAPYLNDQVDDSFRALRQRVVDEVGWDFLAQVDNMFAFLAARPFPGESEKSWNKAARAFDFYARYPISIDPQVEIVREDRAGQTYWRVFLRPVAQDGSRGEPLRQLPWDFSARYDSDPRYYDQGGKYKDRIPDGYYVDFTALAADYGWSRVPALDNWRTFFQGIRYWHFEIRQGLTWDEAIRQLYSDAELDQVFGQ